jgi:hypothetical protein
MKKMDCAVNFGGYMLTWPQNPINQVVMQLMQSLVVVLCINNILQQDHGALDGQVVYEDVEEFGNIFVTTSLDV